MSTAVEFDRFNPYRTAGPPASDSEVVELSLLLPRWQVAALEVAARKNGWTTGQLIRRVVAELLRADSATE